MATPNELALRAADLFADADAFTVNADGDLDYAILRKVTRIFADPVTITTNTHVVLRVRDSDDINEVARTSVVIRQ